MIEENEEIIQIPGVGNNCALYSVLVDSYIRQDFETIKKLLGEELSNKIIPMEYCDFDSFLVKNITSQDQSLEDAFSKFRAVNNLGKDGLISDDVICNFGYNDKELGKYSIDGEDRIRWRFLPNIQVGHFEVMGAPELFPAMQDIVSKFNKTFEMRKEDLEEYKYNKQKSYEEDERSDYERFRPVDISKEEWQHTIDSIVIQDMLPSDSDEENSPINLEEMGEFYSSEDFNLSNSNTERDPDSSNNLGSKKDQSRFK